MIIVRYVWAFIIWEIISIKTDAGKTDDYFNYFDKS